MSIVRLSASAPQLLHLPEPMTMSSREIAELTGKEHRNVLADIRVMAEEIDPQGGLLKFQHTYVNPQNLQSYPEFRLPKRETLILMSGYSIVLRARIIDRWQELEARAAAPQFPIPQSLPEALRLAADLADQNGQLIAKLAEQAQKVDALNRISVATGSLCLRDAAKSLQVRPSELNHWMLSHRWIYRRSDGAALIGYQAKVQAGYLEHKVTTVSRSDGSEKVIEQVRVTGKGMTRLAQLVANRSEAA